MPTREEVMEHICQQFSSGSGEALSPEVRAALEERYLVWIETKKDDAPAKPMEVWDGEDGKGLQKKFRDIGKLASKKSKEKKKTKIDKDDCVEACGEIELSSDSECPYCPEPIEG